MYSTEGYQALRDSSAVVRRGDRGVLAVTGPDRLVWLQGLADQRRRRARVPATAATRRI